MWSNGRQSSNRVNEVLNPAVDKQLASLLCPNSCRLGCLTKDGVSNFPDVLFGMVEVHNLHRIGKVFSHQLPDPKGSISQNDNLRARVEPLLACQSIEHPRDTQRATRRVCKEERNVPS